MIDWEKCPAVESIPGKHGGEWLFTMTRVPVSALFGNLAEGATIEEFLDWFDGMHLGGEFIRQGVAFPGKRLEK